MSSVVKVLTLNIRTLKICLVQSLKIQEKSVKTSLDFLYNAESDKDQLSYI